MFDEMELRRTLDLHERSLQLFLWIGAALKQGQLKYSPLESVLSYADAAKSWLATNDRNLPAKLRPTAAERAIVDALQ